MVGSEGQCPNTPGIEKRNRVSQSHMDPDTPIPSIEDDPSREPHRIVFVLPKLHTIRWCVRILSILITVIAVILILVAIGLYNHAKEHVSNLPIY